MNFWTWLGNNSSQIQTLLTVLGLLFAVITILHGLHQMKVAQVQREFSLKHQIRNECFTIIKRLEELKFKIQEHITNIETQILKESNYSITVDLAHSLEKEKENLVTILDKSNLIKELANKLSDQNNTFSISDIEKISRIQLNILNWIVQFEGFIRESIQEFNNSDDLNQKIINKLESFIKET